MKQFKTDSNGNSYIKTPLSEQFGDMRVNAKYAWKHLTRNTYKEDRKHLSGAFLDTLQNPLLILKQRYRRNVFHTGNPRTPSKIQNKGAEMRQMPPLLNRDIITEDSLVFYKPFKDGNAIYHLAGFAINKEGELINTTFYDLDDNLGKLKSYIKASEKDVLYFNATENSNINQGNAYSYTFTDKQGKTHEIKEEVAKEWMGTFGLKSLDESYVPRFQTEIKEALNKAGITHDFNLTFGSLVKLINKDRLELIPRIKECVESPNKILNDNNGVLFIKEFIGIDKNRYLMSVAKDYNGEWIFSSHARRGLSNIQNKVKSSQIIYDKGFKGEEVAGASDILRSGGTTTKPSDLQIEYPANHSSGKNPSPNSTTSPLKNPLDDDSIMYSKNFADFDPETRTSIVSRTLESIKAIKSQPIKQKRNGVACI